MSDPAPERLLNLAEVERRLSLSRASLYRLMQDGSLPSVKIRGSRRVPESALAGFISDAMAKAAKAD